MQHARHLGVDAVLDTAGHDVGNIHTGNGLADQCPVFGVFEFDVFGGFQLGGCSCQFAVAERALAGHMGDFAQRCFALAGWHAPLLGSRGNQHLAPGGPRFAQVFLRIADGAAAHRSHVAVSAFGAQVFMRCGVLDAHFLPIGLQLLGNHHGRRSHAALAHFSAGVADDNRVVGLDFEPHIQLGRCGRLRALWNEKSHRQARRSGAGDLQEVAAVHAGGQVWGAHARVPFLAAAWMAVRMRA